MEGILDAKKNRQADWEVHPFGLPIGLERCLTKSGLAIYQSPQKKSRATQKPGLS
jgi:hypothetical protein